MACRFFRKVYDLVIESDQELPGFTQVPDMASDWIFTIGDSPLGENGLTWVHEWIEPEKNAGKAVMACATSDKGYLLRFQGIADFSIDLDSKEIFGTPTNEDNPEGLVHLLLDQVIPRVLSHTGRPVLHASSVLLPDGSIIAFLGLSGKGKSTLAAAFHKSGYRVFSDDCLLVEKPAGQSPPAAIAAYPSLRLWSDSRERLFSDTVQFEQIAWYTQKRQHLMKDSVTALPPKALIAAIFILGDSPSKPQGKPIEIEVANGNRATVSLIESLFALDVNNKRRAVRDFGWAADLARSEMPIYVLNFYRKFSLLDDLVASVLEKVETMPSCNNG
jgi:hypothetical protein